MKEGALSCAVEQREHAEAMDAMRAGSKDVAVVLLEVRGAMLELHLEVVHHAPRNPASLLDQCGLGVGLGQDREGIVRQQRDAEVELDMLPGIDDEQEQQECPAKEVAHQEGSCRAGQGGHRAGSRNFFAASKEAY